MDTALCGWAACRCFALLCTLQSLFHGIVAVGSPIFFYYYRDTNSSAISYNLSWTVVSLAVIFPLTMSLNSAFARRCVCVCACSRTACWRLHLRSSTVHLPIFPSFPSFLFFLHRVAWPPLASLAAVRTCRWTDWGRLGHSASRTPPIQPEGYWAYIFNPYNA